MSDLAVGIGLVLVIEGLVWALAPGLGKAMVEATAGIDPTKLRTTGLVSVAIGVAIVWMIRG